MNSLIAPMAAMSLLGCAGSGWACRYQASAGIENTEPGAIEADVQPVYCTGARLRDVAALNLGLRFLLELCMLGAYGHAGVNAAEGALGLLIAVVAIALVAGIW